MMCSCIMEGLKYFYFKMFNHITPNCTVLSSPIICNDPFKKILFEIISFKICFWLIYSVVFLHRSMTESVIIRLQSFNYCSELVCFFCCYSLLGLIFPLYIFLTDFSLVISPAYSLKCTLLDPKIFS